MTAKSWETAENQLADLIRERDELKLEVERLRKLVEVECDKCF